MIPMSNDVGERIPLLSKSRFMAGLQCHKRLYLECFHRELADPMDPAQQAVLDTGTRVGELATGLFPGGVRVPADHLHHETAVATTQKWLSDPGVPAIYEAAFLHDDVRVRADVLARDGSGRFDLIEVKSTTQVKPEHLLDVAIQLYVLKGCGIDPRTSCLCHINKDYVYRGGEYDLERLFTIEDLTDEVLPILPEIPASLDAMRAPLRAPEPPRINPGKHCREPYPCAFYGHCHAGEPDHPLRELPRAHRRLLEALERAGIESIRDIPSGFEGLSALQQRVRDSVVSGRFYLDPDLPEALGRLDCPIHFLDFEAFNPALPLWAGTHPYQMIPFQWSDHTLSHDGRVRHEEFLHDEAADPREPFAWSLLDTLGTAGSIAVYSGFEERRIRELAEALPHLANDLTALNSRLVDLLKLVRAHCYHPDFHGSFSIKAVLPALVPDLGYDDLEINDGGLAAVAYAEMIHPDTTDERREELRGALLAYCKRDTEAELRLFQRLRT